MPHLCLEVFPDMTTMGHLYQSDFSLQRGTTYTNNRSSLQIILLQNKGYFVNINIYFKAFWFTSVGMIFLMFPTNPDIFYTS